MWALDNYVLDQERMILYKKDLCVDYIDIIKKHMKKEYDYCKSLELINNIDPDNLSVKNHVVRTAGIILTQNCQLKCNYCSHSSHNGNNESLTVKDIEIFVQHIIKMRKLHAFIFPGEKEMPLSISITGGGEPTYDFCFFKETVNIIRSMCQDNEMKCRLSLTTNGVLDDTKREFIANNFDEVMISYDGTSDIQDRNRKLANGNSIDNIVQRSLEYFSAYNDLLTIRTTLWPDDFTKMKLMADNLLSRFGNLHEWSLLPVIIAGRALDTVNNTDNVKTNYDEYLECYLELINYVKLQYPDVYINTPLLNELSVTSFCGLYDVECYWLLPNKTITQCTDSIGDEKVIIGEIQNDAIEFYTQYSDPCVKMLKQKYVECRDCIAFPFCRGGCPLKWMRTDPQQIQYKEAECNIQINFVKYFIQEAFSKGECLGWKCECINIPQVPPSSVYKLSRC